MQTRAFKSIIPLRRLSIRESPARARSSIMTIAADLHALQEIDLALDGAEGRLAEIEGQLGETVELAEARESLEARRAVAEELRSRQADLEWSVDEVRRKSGEIETKLYGGSVRNPKELQDLDADLHSLRTQTRTREDTLLSLLVEMEEAETELTKAEDVLAEIETRWDAGQRDLLAEKARLEPEAKQLRASRDAQAANMDRAALSLYQLLRERRGGQAVARVERGMCQGCRITLPMSVLQRARTGAGLVQCVSCERVLLVS